MNASLIILLVVLWNVGVVLAHEGHHASPSGAAQDTPAAAPTVTPAKGTRDARVWFTDTRLLNQHGQQVSFYEDVLKDRIVLLNVIFTSCSDACPLVTRKLREVRDAMGDSADEVYFVSLTSDPQHDTPAVLEAFAARHGAEDPNWIFLTGSQADMDLVLGRLGHLVPTPEQHSTELIVGDVRNKRWSRIRPDAPVGAIAGQLQQLLQPVAGR